MRVADVLAYYGDKNQSEIARALGVTRASVSDWVRNRIVVPLETARAIEILTHKKLRVDESLYPRLKAAHQSVSRQQSRDP